jgi:TPR repeat protein
VTTAPTDSTLDRPLPPPTAFAAPSIPITPLEAFRSGARAMRDGQKDKAIKQLEYAAEQGVVAAQWKLARIYAEGDGVEQSDIMAFKYFSRIADGHADDNPTGPQARYVANAFVSLGHYYREGIADSDVKADLGRARHMYAYAASYFADPDAQYHLGRLLLDGSGANNDPRQAARWLNSAANKGQYQAQAVLGRLLFKGENNLPRQPARGLMWLSVAHSNAGTADGWIGELYESALKQSSSDERAHAADMLSRWVSGRRE